MHALRINDVGENGSFVWLVVCYLASGEKKMKMSAHTRAI